MAICTKAQLRKHRNDAVERYNRPGSKVIVVRTSIGKCQKCGTEISLYDDYQRAAWGQFDIVCPNDDCQQEYFLSPHV